MIVASSTPCSSTIGPSNTAPSDSASASNASIWSLFNPASSCSVTSYSSVRKPSRSLDHIGISCGMSSSSTTAFFLVSSFAWASSLARRASVSSVAKPAGTPVPAATSTPAPASTSTSTSTSASASASASTPASSTTTSSSTFTCGPLVTPCGSKFRITAFTFLIISGFVVVFRYSCNATLTSSACTGSLRSLPAIGLPGCNIVALGPIPKLVKPHFFNASGSEGTFSAAAWSAIILSAAALSAVSCAALSAAACSACASCCC